MKRAGAWLLALAMLVAAWFVSGETPDGEQRLHDPFPVAGALGETVVADNLGVTVHDARFADRVSTGGWSADGTWLVVTLDAWLVHREPAGLGRAYLVVGDRTFLASERIAAYDADAAIAAWSLHVGIPQTGTLAFELPDDIATDADAAAATLQLSLGRAYPNLSAAQNQQGGAVVELPVDLPALEHDATVALPKTVWTRP